MRGLLSVGVVVAAGLGCTGSPHPVSHAAARPSTSSSAAPIAGLRSAWARRISDGCGARDLQLALPFLEGIRLAPAAAALKEANLEHLDLPYPGILSMPLVAWSCGGDRWSAVRVLDPATHPAHVEVSSTAAGLEVRLECFGPCVLDEVDVNGDWRALAAEVARTWGAHARWPSLASRYDRYHFFVRSWISQSGEPLRTDWSEPALRQRIQAEPPRTLAFVFGLDPNEVDLGHYFWSDGSEREMRDLVRANSAVAQFGWLNLRSFKYAIPRLGIVHDVPPEIRAAAKVYADGVNDYAQYVFKALEMCVGSEAWQRSRMHELEQRVAVGLRVIALDEFPIGPRWATEGCRATNHLHRPGDFADEWRVTLEFVRRVSDYAHTHGVLLASEEPSVALLDYTSGYVDGSYNDPPDMYEIWAKARGAERIPLFSTMFGREVTAYTRPPGQSAPPAWLVAEKITAPK